MTPAQRKALVQARTSKLHRLLGGVAILVSVQVWLLHLPFHTLHLALSAACAAGCVALLRAVYGLEKKE